MLCSQYPTESTGPLASGTAILDVQRAAQQNTASRSGEGLHEVKFARASTGGDVGGVRRIKFTVAERRRWTEVCRFLAAVAFEAINREVCDGMSAALHKVDRETEAGHLVIEHRHNTSETWLREPIILPRKMEQLRLRWQAEAPMTMLFRDLGYFIALAFPGKLTFHFGDRHLPESRIRCDFYGSIPPNLYFLKLPDVPATAALSRPSPATSSAWFVALLEDTLDDRRPFYSAASILRSRTDGCMSYKDLRDLEKKIFAWRVYTPALA